MKIKNVIFGIEGESLNTDEKEFFKIINPLGFILFKRNCKDRQQIERLTDELKALSGRSDILILIDQEGGRVARLTPPFFRATKPAKLYGDLAVSDLNKAKTATYINHLLIGRELKSLGINVNCAPCVDLFHDEGHNIIGDRSFSNSPDIVIELSQMANMGLSDAHVQSIIKHIPGHGRATLDSHYDLPIIDAQIEKLNEFDFKVFKSLSDMKMAMTAHIIYNAIDHKSPVTLSSQAIDFIRTELGYEGIILTDDMSMKALHGNLSENTHAAIQAGCDLILHCNGNMIEMQEITHELKEVSDELLAKVKTLNCFSDRRQSNQDLCKLTDKELEEMLKALIE